MPVECRVSLLSVMVLSVAVLVSANYMMTYYAGGMQGKFIVGDGS